MPVSFATLAQTRAIDEFRIATRRLERQLSSGDPGVVAASLQAMEALYAALPSDAQAAVPALAERSAALAEFLRWRALPRAEKTTPIDLRAAEARRAQKAPTATVAALLEGVDGALRSAFLASGVDKRAHLYRAGRMLIAADRETLGRSDVRRRISALAERCGRLGDQALSKALALAADGRSDQARAWLSQRRAQLRSEPIDRAKSRFGSVVAERGKSAEGAPVVRINGAEIPAADWAAIEAARDRTLARYESALAQGSLQNKKISNLAELRTFLLLGRSSSERMGILADRMALKATREPLVEKLTELRARGKKVLLYLEGHDAAGKSSSGQALLLALRQAGYEVDTRSFKAPTAEERKQHWLERFKKSLDENPGVMVWDRGPAGNWAYGTATDKELAELEAFERELQDQGDLVVLKLNLRAEPERQAATFGKRWARALIAEELLESSALDAETRAGLRQITETTLSPNDLPAYASFAGIDARFNAFVDANTNGIPWVRIDTTSRAVARERALAAFAQVIDAAL